MKEHSERYKNLIDKQLYASDWQSCIDITKKWKDAWGTDVVAGIDTFCLLEEAKERG